ncbi:hypothetical protein ACFE33_11265 [Falsihalocynthiibacter sp. SS001]|uniref:hypothetical protein n=1 Tax=Falsihalocynthiibacter sp. SS001 TaxID=3349698 RepID=UPI0036D21213
MKQHIFALAGAIFFAFPVASQEPPERSGTDLLQEGMELLFQELFSEIGPALDDLNGIGEELRPKILDLLGMVDDFRNYDTPEMLPNGDIIIRRNKPLKEGEVDL